MPRKETEPAPLPRPTGERLLTLLKTRGPQTAGDLGERVERLAEARTREGYMAESQPEGDGYLLVENHCPICAAATTCQGFCRAERDVFEKALGPGVTVERTEHIVGGDRRCAYRIALECVADSPTSPKRKKSP